MALADYKLTSFSKPVSALSNNPSQDGVTAEELKAWFDSNTTNEVKRSVNGIIDHILAKDEENEDVLNKKVDKTEGKQLSTNDYTNEEKALVAKVNDKADKVNVIEKNSTTAFTPTMDTHPANKKYVDDTVNEKVKELGAGDMVKAVYDPQGKETDIFAEIAKYLPLTGGTIEKNTTNILKLKRTIGNIVAEMGFYPSGTTIGNTIAATLSLYRNGEVAAYLTFNENGIQLVSGITSDRYNLYGEHNKPTLQEIGALGYVRALTSNDDLNNLRENGIYYFGTDSVPANSPYQNASVVEVFGSNSTATQKIQRVTRYGSRGHCSFRQLSSGSWLDWSTISTVVITAGTTDISANVSALATGEIYQVYE